MKKKQDKKRYLIFLAIIIFLLFLSWIRIVWEDTIVYSGDCAVEYGKGECIDGFLQVPFHNPGLTDVNYVKITVPLGAQTNITLPADFTVNEDFQPGDTGVLKLVPCYIGMSTYNFDIQWCCGTECHSSKMNYPTEKVYIEK
jgi:hypothetical protein